MSDVDRARRRNLLAVGQAMLAGCAVTEEQHLAHEPKARGTQTPFGTTETADAPSSVVTPELAAHLDPNRVPKRMLALDGGGLRGVFTLEFLDSMEAELRRRTGNNALLLRDYFDLIGGTSTGSIIAAALACGMSVAQLKALYAELGPYVFKPSWLRRGLFTPKFDADRVTEALAKQLGANTTLGSEQVRTGLLIMTKRLDTGSPWPVHNHPNGRYGPQNRALHLIDVVRASTAAPTYFQPQLITIGSRTGRTIQGAFVDGGVSPFNDPALQLLATSVLQGYGFGWRTGSDNLLLISVGTARYHAGYKAENIVNMAPALQGLASLQSLMDDDAQVNQMMLQWLTLCLTPWVLDRELGDMKTDSEKGPRLATYARFDALLDHDWLSQNLGVDWTDAQISDAAQMDKPENMKMVAELGRLAADRQFRPEHLPPRFDLPAQKRGGG